MKSTTVAASTGSSPRMSCFAENRHRFGGTGFEIFRPFTRGNILTEEKGSAQKCVLACVTVEGMPGMFGGYRAASEGKTAVRAPPEDEDSTHEMSDDVDVEVEEPSRFVLTFLGDWEIKIN